MYLQDFTLNEKFKYITDRFLRSCPLAYWTEENDGVITIHHLNWKLIIHSDNVDEVILRLDKLIEVNQADWLNKVNEELENGREENSGYRRAGL